MKTLKSIQKNQEQLNSLLMEKWGYKNTLTEEKFDPGEQDEKAKKSSEQKKKESSKDIRAKYAGKHVDPGKQDEKSKKKTEKKESPPEKTEKKKTPPSSERDWISTPPGEKPDADDKEETLEEEHNCKAAHPGKTHEQWAGKHR